MKRTHYLALLWILLYCIPQGTFAQIKIVDPTQEGDFKEIARATPEFRYYYQVKNTSDSAISDLYIMVSPFLSGTSGNRADVDVKINDEPIAGSATQTGDKYGPFSLQKEESLGLELNAHLLQPGSHFGRIIFLSGGESEEIALKVQVKTDSSLAFSIGNIATSRNIVNPFMGRAEFWISIINESNFPQSVRFPDIKSLVKVIAEDDDIDPQYNSIVFNDADGNLLNDDGLIELSAGGSKRIRMSIKGLVDPGKYSGVLRVNSTMGTTVKEKSFILMVKHGWFMASLMILLGVIASTYLKNYLSKIRPKLEVNKTIGTVDKALKDMKTQYADAGSRTQKVLKVIGSEINGAKEAAESGQSAEVPSILAIARKKLAILPEWKEGLDKSMDHHIQQYIGSETQNDLKFLETVLLKANPSPEEFKKSNATLSNIETNLNKVITLIPYHERLDKLEASLEKAANVANIDKARLATLEGARMTQLKADMDAQKLNEVSKMMGKMERELGGLVLSGKMKSVQGMIDKLRTKVETQSKAKKMKPADVTAANGELDKLQNQMLEVEEALDAGNFKEGESMIKKLSIEVKKLSPKDFQSSRSVSKGLSPETLILGDLDAPAAIESGFEKLILKPGNYDPESIDKRIRNNDLIVSAIIAVVALLGGLKLLWAEDLTWGSPTDYLTALLWGLGLHQAGTAGAGGLFGGLGSIQNQLVGGGAAAAAAPAAIAPVIVEEENYDDAGAEEDYSPDEEE